ncbi:hypothetical protein NDU88_006490 [Pleurodeles waltl]|uniref:Uncharacterized protein n=1 Tax=Pleurodeles waltl TaxID=8319 RepID=A0AAV7RM79_PLEWA|nr:hypothetical protein NDU88_006490 [Pleurodeles waltl]
MALLGVWRAPNGRVEVCCHQDSAEAARQGPGGGKQEVLDVGKVHFFDTPEEAWEWVTEEQLLRGSTGDPPYSGRPLDALHGVISEVFSRSGHPHSGSRCRRRQSRRASGARGASAPLPPQQEEASNESTSLGRSTPEERERLSQIPLI